MGRVHRLARFLLVGGIGFVVNTALVALLTGRGVPNLVASLLATETVILMNYTLHEVFTFGTRQLTLRRLGTYNLAAALGLVITAVAFDVVSRTTGLPLILRNLVAVACGTGSNFLLSARFVWGTRPGPCRRSDGHPHTAGMTSIAEASTTQVSGSPSRQ